MKVLHITPDNNGYEEVTLLAEKVNRKNGFTAIEKDGRLFMTGGFIFYDTPEIRAILDGMPKEKQYEFIYSIRVKPYVKEYLEESDIKDIDDKDLFNGSK